MEREGEVDYRSPRSDDTAIDSILQHIREVELNRSQTSDLRWVGIEGRRQIYIRGEINLATSFFDRLNDDQKEETIEILYRNGFNDQELIEYGIRPKLPPSYSNIFFERICNIWDNSLDVGQNVKIEFDDGEIITGWISSIHKFFDRNARLNYDINKSRRILPENIRNIEILPPNYDELIMRENQSREEINSILENLPMGQEIMFKTSLSPEVYRVKFYFIIVGQNPKILIGIDGETEEFLINYITNIRAIRQSDRFSPNRNGSTVICPRCHLPRR
jgi:hypothetical protein